MASKYILQALDSTDWYGFYINEEEALEARQRITRYGDAEGFKTPTRVRHIEEQYNAKGQLIFVDVP